MSHCIGPFSNRENTQALLDSIASRNGWHFVLISLHCKAAVIHDWPTSEFLQSSLAVSVEHWPLVRDLIRASNMPPNEVAKCLVAVFIHRVSSGSDTSLAAYDYGM
jgi:hypothetical protein